MVRPFSWRPSNERLAAMSDNALLLRAMRPGPTRALIALHALAFFAAIGALILLIGPSSTGSWTRAVILGVIFGWVPGLMLVLTLIVYFDERYGPVAYEEELLRRAGWQAKDTLIANARDEWTGMPGPGWLLLFYGRALPHGGEHFVQVTLQRDESLPCAVEFGGLRWALTGSSLDPRKRVYLGQTELLPDEREQLFELLEEHQKGQKSDKDKGTREHKGAVSTIRDGYPFELRALRRGPGESLEFAGNLADPDGPAHTRRLAAMMLDIAQRAGAERSRYGIIDEGHLVFSER